MHVKMNRCVRAAVRRESLTAAWTLSFPEPRLQRLLSRALAHAVEPVLNLLDLHLVELLSAQRDGQARRRTGANSPGKLDCRKALSPRDAASYSVSALTCTACSMSL